MQSIARERITGQNRTGAVMVRLLDGFGAGSLVPSPTPGSVWRVAAYLALYGPTARHRVAGELWPDATQERALGSLRSGVWRIQRELPGLIDARRALLSLTDRAAADVDEFVEVARAVLECDTYVPADGSLLLRHSELLPDWHDEWIVVERERLRQLRLDALDALAGRLLARGSFGLGLQNALAALGTDPLRESSCQRVIQAYLLQGNTVQARRHYEFHATRFRNELGVEPAPFRAALVNLPESARALAG
ncbi:AfsR/SARP family transcriptional regulator [Streptomyces guryensis]|nr:BTAD domain-containing putative transcriptional regulator [Streptomyces guryensis]